MSIHVALNHVTHYRYDRRVALGPQVVRLRPAPHCRTPILSYSLTIEPVGHFVNWQQDPFANHLARLVFPEKTTEFKVTVDLVAEMSVYNPFDFFLEEDAEHFPFDYEASLKVELAPYLVKGELTPALKAFIASIKLHDKSDPQRTIDFLVGINQRLQHDIRYLIRMEPGVQTPEETLTSGSGSCRDTGWLMVQALRHFGLAARFASGYLIQLKPDVKSLDGPVGASHDFTDLHAWCEVYLPGAGWIGLDPTSGLMAGEGHIPLACTPEPSSAAPVSGAVDKSEVTFGHEMKVTRIFESPRVTRPYTDEQWAQVLSLGHHVDAALSAGDVRLTQGGEPTFVSVQDREGAEWNTAALGPTKRGIANELVQKLRARYGVGGFLHFGQGKWYPGEQLPRWALSIFWRRDGEPCWAEPSLFADERLPSSNNEDDAKRFIDGLTRKLGLPTDFIEAGFEDTWYYLWRERRLPTNVDPFDARLDDEMERARLRKVFEQGLKKVVGYMLPIARAEGSAALAGARWITGGWFLRNERMYLMPGDSPMGYRLPLDSLPWVSKADYPYLVEADPYAPPGKLRANAELRAQYGVHALGGAAVPPVASGFIPDGDLSHLGEAPSRAGSATGGPAKAGALSAPLAAATAVTGRAPARFESAKEITRTALVVETRAGILYVFMPPLKELDDYLDLLAAVEAQAAEQGVKIVLEGYPPPRDARLKMLQVTPDPGVIEVNIHPAHDWDELVDHTEFLYEAAHETRLSTEKFMLDGRHTGTGGGNHFVLGGATPPDSPFLRRPDLLASLLAYWHNHPSLSYLFSGMFIGPTSQAPRIDEARNDQVVELEIALAQIEQQLASNGARDGAGAPSHSTVAPWTVDRALRNILIDVSGNTHRAEFCIDKLYSPDGPTGRLGLLELRAFEMPPHARMSLVQQLLLRAMIAWFWRSPYPGRAGRGPGPVAGQQRLTRWGTELHDRFLLPSFVQQDFDDVLADLSTVGYAFDPAWFAPHFEFRFPMIGELNVAGVKLTIRTALEPWHVMGEEGSAGGTVRYVDSSLERVEVRAQGLNGNRHVVTVNGRALPMQPLGGVTGQHGRTHVAGVRYKAWAPPSALHPTIGTHAPLTFDLVDAWMGRSLGGGRYHVSHPGGLSHENFPVNAYEAESRRLARFFQFGHTPGPMQVSPAMPSREFPFTLDLRRSA